MQSRKSSSAIAPARPSGSRTGVRTVSSTTTTARATAARPAAPARSTTTRAARPAAGSLRPAAAKKARDPSHRGMADPWFSFVVAGLKTKDIRQIGGFANRPDSTVLGYDNVKVGDVITWANGSMGVERLVKVEVTAVTPCKSSQIEEMLSKRGASAKFMPTLTTEQALQVSRRLLRIQEGTPEREFLCFDFKLV